MNWLKKWFGKKPTVIDSNELMKNPYTMYVSPLGVLVINSNEFYGRVVGVCEWSNNNKTKRNIEASVVVLDIKVQTIIIHK